MTEEIKEVKRANKISMVDIKTYNERQYKLLVDILNLYPPKWDSLKITVLK